MTNLILDHLDILQAHEDKVRSLVPKEQLLEMDLNDGWEPLCKFLGVPVPNEPFPRANDGAAADKYATKVLLKVLGVWLSIFSVVGYVLLSGYWLWKRKMSPQLLPGEEVAK